MTARAIAFDLDGTLTDPKAGITRSIAHAMTALGRVAPDADLLHWCIGPPLRDSFSRLLDSSDEALLDRAMALYRERFSTIGLFENALYPDVPDAVRTVRAAGFRTYVATSKPRVFAVRIVEHFALASLFHGIYGSELDGRRADKGELIAHMLAAEGLDPAHVVMVGDRQHDMIGAVKCGLRGIGVTYGYGTEAELRAHGAAAIAASPRDIATRITEIYGR